MALWPLWVIAQAPRAFWLNLVRIPSLYGHWLHEIGKTFGKATLTLDALKQPGYLVLLILAVFLVAVAWRERSRLNASEKRGAAVTALLVLLFFVIAYIPPTMWHQYLAVPVPFLVLALAYPLAALRRLCRSRSRRERLAQANVRPCRSGRGHGRSGLSRRVVPLPVPHDSRAVDAGGISQEPLSKIAGDIKEPGLVLTLGPLHALEGGRDICPELSCGSIVYRVADLLSAPEREDHPHGRAQDARRSGGPPSRRPVSSWASSRPISPFWKSPCASWFRPTGAGTPTGIRCKPTIDPNLFMSRDKHNPQPIAGCCGVPCLRPEES